MAGPSIVLPPNCPWSGVLVSTRRITVDVGIVDDDQSVQIAVERLLRSAGYTTRSYLSAQEYLAASTVVQFRCLVLDLILPGMSGLSLLQHLQETDSRVPTIILSAHDEPGIQNAAQRSGAAVILMKPAKDDTFLQAVRSILAH